MRVWVTRAEPGAARTAEALRRRGHEPLIAPVLELHRLAVPAVDLDGVGALAFTSANGVDAYAALNSRRDLPVFAVGAATAETARSRGFVEVRSAEGDVAALAALIGARRAELTGYVLHPGALEPAGDLAGALRAAGVPARALAVYDTVGVEALPTAAASALVAGCLDAALVHSPKAGGALARLLAAPGRRVRAAERLILLGLSPACVAPLTTAGFHTFAASAPYETALLDRLDGLAKSPEGPSRL